MKYSPYSFSKIHTFFDCQKKFEFTYVNKIAVDKDYDDPSYFKRGRFLHTYIAERLKGGSGLKMKGFREVEADDKLNLVNHADNTLENEYISMTYDFDENMVESYISLDRNLEPVTKKTRTAIGGYIDYAAIKDDFGVIVDWKTGRYRDDTYYSQLELYAIWLFQKHPEITEIDLVFYYVEHNKIKMKTITPEDVATLKNDLMNRINTIENTDEFHTSESKQCLHCKFFNTCMDEFDITGLSRRNS